MSNICSVDGCNNPVKYKGLCGKHYKRQWRHGDPTKTMLNMNWDKCKVEGCTRLRRSSNGYCNTHRTRMIRYGREHRIKALDGEGCLNADGYKLLTVNGDRVYEHVHLAEKALGKSLPKGAVVHHMNENRADNHTPFNLVVCPSQLYHVLLHQRMKLYELGLLKTENKDGSL